MAKSLKLEVARARIHGDEPVVVVEAAAGCGKTHEAVEATVRFAAGVDNGQEVLVLTQTNAARNVSADRLRDSGARAQTQTLDSLAARLSGDTCASSNLRSRFVPASSTALSSSSGRRPPQVLRGR